MKYLLVFVLLYTIASSLSSYLAEEISVFTIADNLVYWLITAWGVVICYKANAKGDNEEFIDRFICTSLPITIRYIVILIGVYIVYMTAGYITFGDAFDRFTEKWNIVDSIITNSSLIFIYLWQRRYMLKISGANN